MSIENPEAATTALEKLKSDRVTEQVAQVEASEHRETVESRDVNFGTIDIKGDHIPVDKPLGLGRRARIAREAMRADERGDDAAQLDAILDMIDALDDATPERFGTVYWDDLGEQSLKDAFQQLGTQSSGGADAGN